MDHSSNGQAEGDDSPLQSQRSTPEAEKMSWAEALNPPAVRPKRHNPALTDAFDRKVRPYIDLIDRLRAYGLDQDVGLPAVAVIGDQSSGKSSTLEAISGIQLPRGAGIVTRCPLELRMKYHRNGLQPSHFWKGSIKYKKADGTPVKRELETAELVGDLVKKAQDEMTSGDLGISHELITLEVESPNVPDLTLIDLPGIARVAVGDQPTDIGDQIKRLIHTYIMKKETIILAVIPSNVDIATTEALKMAQELDKDGERTLGVLTKPDLVDKGAEAQVLQAVNNQIIPLKKGYTIVKCRGQQAIMEGQTLEEAMHAEATFFQSHDKFRDLQKNQRGIPTLALKLTSELVEQIKHVVPDLKNDIKIKLEETKAKLRILGSGPPTSVEGKQAVLLKLVSRFSDDFKKLSIGEYNCKTKVSKKHRLLTLARHQFTEFAKHVRSFTPIEEDLRLMRTIKEDIDDHRGRELRNFIMYPVFENLVRTLMDKPREPAHRCLDDVNIIMKKILEYLIDEIFAAYHDVRGMIKTRVARLQTEALDTCEEKIEELFNMENLVYSQDTTYMKEIERIEKRRAKKKAEEEEKRKKLAYDIATLEQRIDPDEAEAQHVLDGMKAYFDVASRRILDMVPMIIRYQMMDTLVENVHEDLLNFAAHAENIEYVCEDQMTEIEREELQERKERLMKAEKDLSMF